MHVFRNAFVSFDATVDFLKYNSDVTKFSGKKYVDKRV